MLAAAMSGYSKASGTFKFKISHSHPNLSIIGTLETILIKGNETENLNKKTWVRLAKCKEKKPAMKNTRVCIVQ